MTRPLARHHAARSLPFKGDPLSPQIDLQKMPLGKLSKRQIQAAYSILSEVQQVSEGPARLCPSCQCLSWASPRPAAGLGVRGTFTQGQWVYWPQFVMMEIFFSLTSAAAKDDHRTGELAVFPG